jgi:cysteinyl-tRNA synthetase
MWKEQNKEELRKELDEKARQKVEEARKKMANKIAEKEKEIAKWTAATVDPAEYFSIGDFAGKYTAARNEKGLPTHLADGEEVPKKQMKANEKGHADRVKAREQFLANGGPDFLEKLKQELAKLKEDFAATNFDPPPRGGS